MEASPKQEVGNTDGQVPLDQLTISLANSTDYALLEANKPIQLTLECGNNLAKIVYLSRLTTCFRKGRTLIIEF